MYEIWLMLNIVYELALTVWPWLLALLVLWLILMALALKNRAANWRSTFPTALVLGALLGVAIFFITPTWSRSGLAYLNYWVDWANLIGITVAWTTAGTLFAWPFLTWLRKRSATA